MPTIRNAEKTLEALTAEDKLSNAKTKIKYDSDNAPRLVTSIPGNIMEASREIGRISDEITKENNMPTREEIFEMPLSVKEALKVDQANTPNKAKIRNAFDSLMIRTPIETILKSDTVIKTLADRARQYAEELEKL